MAHPLDGVYVKLSRADEHLKSVQAAIRDIAEEDPESIPGEFQADRRRYVFRAQHDSQTPDWLSGAVGDCVHNFRAALDFCIWELVGGESGSGSSKTEFPIFADPDLYAKWAPEKIRGVPKRAEAAIERLQPFYGPNSQPFHPEWRDPTSEPLWLLYELDKWDKHRALNLTEDVLSLNLMGFGALGIYTSPTPARLPGRFKRGAIIATFDMGDFPEPEVDVHLSAAFEIAFDRKGPAAGEPVIKTLYDIRGVIRTRVVPTFARFFPPRPPE